jgi:hypothetical protein
MFEISGHGGYHNSAEIQKDVDDPTHHGAKHIFVGKNLLYDGAELPQHKHIDEQVLPVGVDEAVREEAIPLAGHLPHSDGMKNELALYLGVAERLNGNQRGEDNDDDGKTHVIVGFL